MLRDLQKEKIMKFLNPDPEIFYKILILDEETKDIITPLIKLNDLREIGITTFFMIKNKRESIKDIPAVYFVQPTNENINIILEDITQKKLYTLYTLNFSSLTTRDYLEHLALECGRKQMAEHVISVFDQHIEFISLQNHLFTFNINNSFCLRYDFNNWKKIASMLFNVFFTLDEQPLILTNKTSNESAGYNISKILMDKFRNVNVIKKSRKKPLLIILEREFDMITPIKHPWSYNSLISDLLEYKNNKIGFKTKQGNEEKMHGYEMDDTDNFFFENQFESFPTVSEKIEKELVSLKTEMAMKSIDDKADKNKINEILENAPGLRKRNDSINAHMKVCFELLNRIKERSIDEFYRLENLKNIKNEEMMFISEKGTVNDIIRLSFTKKGIMDCNVLKAMLEKRSINHDIYDCSLFKKGNEGVDKQSMYSAILGNVKKLLPISNEPLIFNEIENIYSYIYNSRYFDEKYCLFGESHQKNMIFAKEINKIIVFVIGTGNYSEFNSLKNLQKKIGIETIYGCDQIVNSDEFLNQVSDYIKN